MDAHHTYIGDYTNVDGGLFLTLQERLRHIAIVGATGSGKSTLLRHLARQDMERGDGILLLDQHGDLAEAVLSDVPARRHNHVCYLDVGDLQFPVALNVLEDTLPDDRAAAVDGVVSAMHSIWFESWGPRMEIILRHACRVLIEAPGGSLLHLPRLLTDDTFRADLVARVSDPVTRSFFGSRFGHWRDTYRDEAIEPVLNKVEAFLAFPAIRNTLGQSRSSLHLPYAMQHGRIVIVNLASGVVGETAARLFGALLLGRLRTAAMARAKMPGNMRRPFHVLVDEAQAFGPASIASLLSEIRKYFCSVVLATQFLDGLTDTTRAALLGNAGTLAVFRCAPQDAEVLAPNFDRPQQAFNPFALQALDIGEAIVRSMQLDPASVSIPASPVDVRSTDPVKLQSRQHYGRSRADVEDYIMRVLGNEQERRADDATTATVQRWPLSLRVLRAAIYHALDEHGTFMGSPDGTRTISAVDIQHVRSAFAQLRVADAETGDERAAARDKAFKRAVESAQQRRLIGARDDGTQWVWIDKE